MPRQSAPARRLGQLLTAGGALILLTGLLAGVPWLLYTVAGNPLPTEVPTVDQAVTS